MTMKKLLMVSACALMLTQTAFARPGAGSVYTDMPTDFHEINSTFDYVRRDVMIPMRDGVRLHTVILVPKDAKNAGMLMTRTPYNAAHMASLGSSSHMASILPGYDNMPDVIVDGGYIRVLQDIRGKYGSEGEFVMNRPMRGPLNSTAVDESTDTWDTIEWLVHNVPQSNGKVGILGVSYDGYTAITALFHPHPALKVSVPMNPMVDGWMGDDWFHNGAFREEMLPYIYDQGATRKNTAEWWSSTFDSYTLFLNGVSAGAVGKSRGMDQIGFFRQLLAHPAYDSWWQLQALDRLLPQEGLKVPTMLIHSLWDQEDNYGAIAVYDALRKHPEARPNLWLAMGPWNHGGEIHAASMLGSIDLHSDTGLYFRRHVLMPFLAHYLKDEAIALPARVTAYRSGEDEWETMDSLPAPECDDQCSFLYFQQNHGLAFKKASGSSGHFTYVSDPDHPVPYVTLPVVPKDNANSGWRWWLTADQRNAAARPDVLSLTSAVLTAPFTITGEPLMHLTAATTGTDGDFVVKLIDVYPDEVASQPAMGGYQLMVSGNILRGRYRKSFEHPEAVPANEKQIYPVRLPMVNHTFLPGHRIMIQVQSSWFPLYDRNPQTYVDNIMVAPKEAYKPATISVDVSESWLELHGSAKSAL
ncbi:CocE/NonD family hydrolase [Gluconobacter japonicus]|uniref:CocE/NonD family hydrolase n=1 Tax=Gluconobacter japonicus TaxID=376620 RepID=A0A9Q2IRC2_GLUJA|nr:CocE/NonD family hydrolase [Gluconobacter japonicus]